MCGKEQFDTDSLISLGMGMQLSALRQKQTYKLESPFTFNWAHPDFARIKHNVTIIKPIQVAVAGLLKSLILEACPTTLQAQPKKVQ